MQFGGVETGGTWTVCAVGHRARGARPDRGVPHRGPRADDRADRAVLRRRASCRAAIGVGAFGPLDLDRRSPSWGTVTRTPKPGWTGAPLGRALQERLEVPVAFDTDVAAAGVAEHRWGAGRGVEHLCYLTVGTGIGAALLRDGRAAPGTRPPGGRAHPDPARPPAGPVRRHLPAPRRLLGGAGRRGGDRRRAGAPTRAGCPTSTRRGRWRRNTWRSGWRASCSSPRRSGSSPAAASWSVPACSPPCARRLRDLVAGYLQTPLLEDEIDRYLVAPELGDRAGVLGAMAMAERLHHAGLDG